MNFYKKVNQYFVNHFPTLWNTHFVWILLFTIIMHVLSYAIGYAYVDISVMKKVSFYTLVFKSNYFSLYMILSLLLLIYLCIQFFSHNPLKSFYPVPKHYLIKVASVLLPLSMLWMMLPFTFLKGAREKTLSISSTADLAKESKSYYQMKPLLFEEKEDYHITNRNYPDPFPLQEWNKYHNDNIQFPLNKNNPYVTLGGTDYQFGNEIDINPDTCVSEMIFQPIDVQKVYGLAEYSLLNYPSKSNDGDENSNTSSIANLHRYYMNKDRDSLMKLYHEGIAVLKKYDIENNLNAERMTELLLEQDLNQKQIIITGTQNEYNDIVSYTDTSVVNKFYYAENEFEEISSFHFNALRSGYYDNDWFWIVLMGSLVFISILISVKHIPLIPLVMSICITGILGIITGLIFVAAEKVDASETSLISLGMVISIIVILAALYIIYKARYKKLAQFSILPLTAGYIGLVTSLFALVHQLSKYKVVLPCNQGIHYDYAYEIQLSHIIIPSVLVVLLLFHAIRHVHTRSENS